VASAEGITDREAFTWLAQRSGQDGCSIAVTARDVVAGQGRAGSAEATP
jgi:hypothetical protein